MENKLYYRNDLDESVYLYNEGKNYESYEFLGAHKIHINKKEYISFCVWAPHAKEIFLTGDFNEWNDSNIPLHNINNSGIWNVCVADVNEYDAYKYRIITNQGWVLYKADPYAFYAETRPHTASKVYEINSYKWSDEKYIESKIGKNFIKSPMSIYELHLGSWFRHPDGRYYTYKELEERLPEYIKKMGFTHVEFLPITEHPFDGSWGYQVTGYFAATSRFGTPKELMSLINKLHLYNIGVIMDWVPVHFTKDAHGLIEFDGTYLYEKTDPYSAQVEGWGTLYFDYGKQQVKNFLISSALFWLKYFHVDGIRVDAVAAMLYLNYGGKNISNKYGGIENLDAIDFLKELNWVVHQYYPTALMIAEESTAWPNITKPVDQGGLGFDFKWNMGWMNDTLRYFEKDPVYRKYHQNLLTFSITYCFSENYVLPFSHDEVVHLKGSMINKMPGDYDMKFKGLKSLYAYQYAHPGKKLLFMGSEIATFEEWNEDKELSWSVLNYDSHRNIQDFVKDLNNIYKTEKSFYENDDSYDGYQWIEHENHDESIIIFERIANDEKVICVFNLTPVYRSRYRIGVDDAGIYKVLINSAHKKYGGYIQRNTPLYSENISYHGREHSINVDLPEFGAIFIKLSHKK